MSSSQSGKADEGGIRAGLASLGVVSRLLGTVRRHVKTEISGVNKRECRVRCGGRELRAKDSHGPHPEEGLVDICYR